MGGFSVMLYFFVFLNLCGIITSTYCPTQYFSAATYSKTLHSKNYPQNVYPLATTCYWRITAPYGYVIQLKFIDFTTYKYIYQSTCSSYSSHTLFIYDGSSAVSSLLLGAYCGNTLPANVISSGRYMYLKFRVYYNSHPNKGFNLTFTAVKDSPDNINICSPFNSFSTNNNIRLYASSGYQEIQSPLYPDKYPSNTQCTWYITASSSLRKILLTYKNASIFSSSSTSSSCSSTRDILTIHNGRYSYSKNLQSICSKTTSNITVKSSSRYMTIRFKTDSDNYFVGNTARFLLKFKEVDESTFSIDPSICSPGNSNYTNNNIRVRASSKAKYITSPWYPLQYPTNIQCTWYITASSNSKRIRLTSSYTKLYNRYYYPCNRYSTDKDILIITDGASKSSNLLKVVCGSSYSTVRSTGRYMTVQFKTNSDDYFLSSKPGFELKYYEYEYHEDSENTSNIGKIIGIFIAVSFGFSFVVYCTRYVKRVHSPGQTHCVPASTVLQTTTMTRTGTTPSTPQYPIQDGIPPPIHSNNLSLLTGNYATQGPGQGSYQSQGQGSYPPPGQGSYPPPGQGSYLPPGQGSYLPPGQGYPPPGQGAHPSTGQGSYPPPSHDNNPSISQATYLPVSHGSQLPPGQGNYPLPGQDSYPNSQFNYSISNNYPSDPPPPYLPPVDDPIPNLPPPKYPGPST